MTPAIKLLVKRCERTAEIFRRFQILSDLGSEEEEMAAYDALLLELTDQNQALDEVLKELGTGK